MGIETLTENRDVNGTEVKVGDKVVCVDAEASFNRLVKGACYTVEAAYDGSPIVFAGRTEHSIERFKVMA